MTTVATPPSSSLTAVAVCGCGHDGRLGLGSGDDNVSTPTLLPFFLPSAEGEPLTVLAVACGGYHTLVLTSHGLYGWGMNDCGQLGVGKHLPTVTTPTRLKFFDGMVMGPAAADAGEDDAERVVRVSCGNTHSFVLTTEALYCCGANENGQLGIGHGGGAGLTATCARPDDSVFDWWTVCEFGPGRRAKALAHKEGRAPVLPLFLLSPSLGVVACTVVDVSCGTNHTLVALEDVVTVGGDGESSTASADQSSLRYWACMVLAAGKGDFGELGYDGSAEEIERDRYQTKQRSVLQAAMTREMQGGGDFRGAPGPSSVNDPLFKYKARYQTVKRRPAFSSTSFRRVPLLEGELAPTALPEWEATAHDAAALEVAVRDQRERLGAAKPRILFLDASHLHSAVTVYSGEPKTVHWGCYYCNQIETAESSLPRPVAPVGAKEMEDSGGLCQRVHGGNEIFLQYTSPPAPAPGESAVSVPGVRVIGKGSLGFGEEDDFTETARELPGTEGVVRIAGRDHFLLLQRHVVDGRVWTAVLGFGGNLHGQLGSLDRKQSSHHPDGDDQVTTPRVLVKCGDRIGDDWVVESVRDVAAGARHSVFLLHVVYSPSSQ